MADAERTQAAAMALGQGEPAWHPEVVAVALVGSGGRDMVVTFRHRLLSTVPLRGSVPSRGATLVMPQMSGKGKSVATRVWREQS